MRCWRLGRRSGGCRGQRRREDCVARERIEGGVPLRRSSGVAARVEPDLVSRTGPRATRCCFSSELSLSRSDRLSGPAYRIEITRGGREARCLGRHGERISALRPSRRPSTPRRARRPGGRGGARCLRLHWNLQYTRCATPVGARLRSARDEESRVTVDECCLSEVGPVSSGVAGSGCVRGWGGRLRGCPASCGSATWWSVTGWLTGQSGWSDSGRSRTGWCSTP
jgi:hypothetical protein